MGWNGSSRAAVDEPPAKEEPRAKRGAPMPWSVVAAAAAVLLAAGAAVAFFVLRPAKPECVDTPKGAAKPRGGLIESHEPAKPSPRAQVEKDEPEGPAEPVARGEDVWVQIANKRYNLTEIAKTDPARATRISNEYARVEAELERARRSPVKGAGAQLLMMSTPGEKGDSLPPLPITNDDFDQLEREADRMLAQRVEVEDHDTDSSLELKEKLLALKAEFAAARERGVSFAEFLRDRESRAKLDAEHLEDAIHLDKENYDDRTLSDEQYLTARDRIDKLLKMEGFRGLPKLEGEVEDEDSGEDRKAGASAAQEGGAGK